MMATPAPTVPGSADRAVNVVYAERPLLIYWELTRACELACRHCRAEAVARRDPRELTTTEAGAMLQQLVGFGEPFPRIVLTGGDPLQRPDLFQLIARARGLGFPTAITPSGTYALTQPAVQRLKEAGIDTVAVSLDGSDAARHDGIRCVPGSFDWTLKAARHIREAGIPLQINSLVCAETLDDMPAMAKLVESLDAMRWSVFFLVKMGRGQPLQEISPGQTEEFMNWLCELMPRVPFQIKTTEAPHFRRVALQRAKRAGVGPLSAAGTLGDATKTPREGTRPATPSSIQRGFGIRDGNGIMFLSHIGEVFPSGFLPVAAGSVRAESPVELYRNHSLFRSLRDMDQLQGKCGCCEFRKICGGSRARAYAATGDPLGSDPLCPYLPPGSR